MAEQTAGTPALPRGGWRGKADLDPSAAKQVRRVLLTIVTVILVALMAYLLWRWHFRAVTHFVYLPVVNYNKLAVPPVPFSDEDFQRLKEDLPLARPVTEWRNLGTSADMKNLPRRLRSLGSRPKDSLIFFVCGHGVSSGDSAYLLCSNYLLETGEERYPLADLLDEIRGVPAKLKLLILDVGYITSDPRLGMLANEFPRMLEDELEQGDLDSNLWVLTANRPMQTARAAVRSKQSIFAHFVVEGLSGAADRQGGNDDGKVALGELYAYVCKGVRTQVRYELGTADAQTPWLLRDGEGEVSKLPDLFLVMAADREPDERPESEGDDPAEASAEKPDEPKKPEPKKPALPKVPKPLEELRQLSDRIQSRTQLRDPGRSEAPWAPVDYAPHRWREFQELLGSYELRHRYGAPSADDDLGRVSTEAKRDFAAADNGLKSDRDVGFDSAAQGIQRVGRIRALIQLKNDLLYWAPYYVRWYVRSSQVSATHQANTFDMVSTLLRDLRRLLEQFDEFEQAGLDEKPSEDMQTSLERLEQSASDLRDQHERLQEALDDAIDSVAKTAAQGGNTGRIEVLLSIPSLSATQRTKLLGALADLEGAESDVGTGALALEQLKQGAARYAAQQKKLLPKVAQLQRELALLSGLEASIELPEEAASPDPEAYRLPAAELQAIHQGLPGKVNAVTGSRAPAVAEVRSAERCLRLVDSCDVEGRIDEPIRWALLRAVSWSEVLVRGPADVLRLKRSEPTRVPLTIQVGGRAIDRATVTMTFDPEVLRIESVRPAGTVQPRAETAVLLSLGENTLEYEAMARTDSTRASSTDLEVTVRAGTEVRSLQVTFRLPSPDEVRLLAYRVGRDSDLELEQAAEDRIQLRPFPNRPTGFRFELENLSEEAKQLEVQLVGIEGYQRGEVLAEGLLFDSSGGLRSGVEALAPPVSMTLPAESTPQPIPFALPEPPLPQPGQPPPEPEQTEPEPKPRVWACAIFDRGEPATAGPKWVYWIDFLPLVPREYVEILGGRPEYDDQQGRLTIRATPRGTDARGRAILPADLATNPLLLGWDPRDEASLRSLRKSAKIASPDAVAELFAEVDPLSGRMIDVDLGIDGYPRGFTYRVECRRNGQILDMQDRIDVRITAPASGGAYRLPLEEPIPVAFEVDVPPDAFLDTQGLASQHVVLVRFVGEEDAPSFSPVEIDRFHNDRLVDVFLPKIDPPGVLNVLTKVSDFELRTDNRGLENVKVRLQVRLELPNLKVPEEERTREDSIEIVLDGKPPVVQLSPLGTILPGQPLELAFYADDLSGVRNLEARFSETKTPEVADGEPVVLAPQYAADGRWHASLKTDKLEKTGTYWLLWRVFDRAGNVTDTMVDQVTIRAPRSPTPEAAPTTGTITGQIVSTSGEPRAGAEVTLDPLGHTMEADGDGKFSFRDVPAGTCTLRISQRIKGQSASTSRQVEVQAGKTLSLGRIELSMWSKDEQ